MKLEREERIRIANEVEDLLKEDYRVIRDDIDRRDGYFGFVEKGSIKLHLGSSFRPEVYCHSYLLSPKSRFRFKRDKEGITLDPEKLKEKVAFWFSQAESRRVANTKFEEALRTLRESFKASNVYPARDKISPKHPIYPFYPRGNSISIRTDKGKVVLKPKGDNYSLEARVSEITLGDREMVIIRSLLGL